MEHKVRYRPTRTGSALVGLAIFLSASGFGLITESDAWIPSQPKPWRYKNTINQNRWAGNSGGTISPQRGVNTLDPYRGTDLGGSSVKPTADLAEQFKKQLQALKNSEPLGGSSLKQFKDQSERINKRLQALDTKNSLPYKEWSTLETLRRGYKEKGLVRILEKAEGYGPSASELRAIAADDYPDWQIK